MGKEHATMATSVGGEIVNLCLNLVSVSVP
jgi:hypothetical protein